MLEKRSRGGHSIIKQVSNEKGVGDKQRKKKWERERGQ